VVLQERKGVKMQLLLYLSNFMIPIVIFYIVGYGLLNHTDIFDEFIKGAAEGFQVVLGVLPTLIGLMLAIGILRASGFMEMFGGWIAPLAERVGFPTSLVPLTLIKLVSSSGATGLLLDIYKEYGTDSKEGFLASLLMCCSETVFYTISVYFIATGDKEHPPVTKLSWTLAGALLSTFVGIVVCVWLCRGM
jgi:spore maturation protein B